MHHEMQFNPATVAFEPADESTPLSRLLAALRAMVLEYPAGRTIRGDREGRHVEAARWMGLSHTAPGEYSIWFDCESDAVDYRERAVALIAESGIDGETSISGRVAVWTVRVTLYPEAL